MEKVYTLGMVTFFEEWPWWGIYVALPIMGMAAGFINTIAGGGSFLTLPVLMYMGGMPAQIANATNRFSVVFYTTTSTGVYYRNGYGDVGLTKRLLLPSVLGAVGGSYTAAVFPSEAFSLVFGGAMVAMAVMLMWKPRVLLEAKQWEEGNWVTEMLLFFAIGFYGGFVQGGTGFLLLVGLAITHGRDLIHANGVKVSLALGYAIVSVSVFAYYGQIDYLKGLLLAGGAMGGALIGAKMAIKRGVKFVYYVVVAVAILTGMNMIYRSLMEMLCQGTAI